MDRLIFERGGKEKIFDIIESGEKCVFDFLNAYSVFLFRNNRRFRNSFRKCRCYNFPDGITISIAHFLKHGKMLRRVPGPVFMEHFLKQERFTRGRKHFFLGIEGEDISKIARNFEHLKMNNVRYYNPPYIKGDKFSDGEIKKIVNLINREKVDYLWIGLGNPKKEILAGQIFGKSKFRHAFSVGAAFDFLSGTKGWAPRPVRMLGLEWLYRLVTDFGYSSKKVRKSFSALTLMKKLIEFRD